jgi:hypothetical protein
MFAAVVGCMTALSRPAEAAAAAPERALTTAAPTTKDVLAAVRKATGSRQLERLRGGFSIEEVETGPSAKTTVTHFGARGELRRGPDLGFDGTLPWRVDEKRGGAVPLNLRQFEKQAWPLWIRSHWWLSARSGIEVTLLPAESDARVVALRLATRDRLVPATVFIDRTTWLPERLVVPYDRGPMIVKYSDYRSALGAKLAFATEASYRETTRHTVRDVRPLAGSDAQFSLPPASSDAAFDNGVPAELPLKYGVPFGNGASPHVYVTPEIDGKASGSFLFDSGADGMMIDAALADSLEMPVIGRTNSTGADGTARAGTFRRGKTFRLGRLTITNPVYLAIDLSKNNAPAGEARAGVVGYDVFARAVVEFHGVGRRVALHDPRSYRLPRGSRWQQLSFIDSTPAIAARLDDGVEERFQIDTGSVASVEFYPAFVDRRKLLTGRDTTEHVSRGAGGTYTVRTGKVSSFAFGGRRFRDQEVTFRTSGLGRDGGAGVIGRELMAGFTTVFDYPSRRIAFIQPAQ